MIKDWRQTLGSKLVLGVMLCCGNGLVTSGQVSNSIVIPNEYSDKIADGVGGTLASHGVWQFTYSNSQFQSIGDQDITITSVALRPKLNGLGSSLDVVIPEISISMGTFTKPLAQLSSVAANNRGLDFKRVYTHQNVGLHFIPAGDPNNFAIVFDLDQPFHYNPKNGQFMFEWTALNFQGSSEARVDGTGYPPSQSEVYLATELGDDLIPEGFILDLKYTVVPEPSPLIVMVVLGGLGVMALNSKIGRKTLGKRTDTD
jgi:hypothetical protein